MFGMAPSPFFLPGFGILGDESNADMGDQVRGFGFFHDGSVDTLMRFHGALAFIARPELALGPNDPGNPGGFPFLPPTDAASLQVFAQGLQMRRDMEQFMLAFDSNLAPIVGQQITLTHSNASVARPRIQLLMARADAGECDLVAKKRLGAAEAGYLYTGNGLFTTAYAYSQPVTGAKLRKDAKHKGHELTYTCVPLGSGVRIALDRDRDGYLDGDERNACSDPADPSSTPLNP
jgi:hypothetical protein